MRRIFRTHVRLPEVNINIIAPRTYPPVEPIYDDICMPPYFEGGWFLHNDFGVLTRLLQHFQPTVVFEYGTAHGNTTANVCRFTDAKVFTLNALPEQISGHTTTFTLTKDEIGRVYRNSGYSERVTQIYANSLHFDPEAVLGQNKIDFCIVDACHDAPFVINDFTLIEPHVAPGGIVLLHDTHPSRAGHLHGSYDACVQLRRKGFDMQHIEDCWWGYWRKPVNRVR